MDASLSTAYMHRRRKIGIIGGGPAGLRAAEVCARNGAEVTLFDAKPSVGRKFLVAGKSGLNLTNDAEFEAFASVYGGSDFPEERWKEYFRNFDNNALRDWAAGYGVETFAAPNGKVFPVSKKAAPLLRRWVLELRRLGVQFRMKHAWVGLDVKDSIHLNFMHEGSTVSDAFNSVVLALGGASWPQTGSTGTWQEILKSHGVEITPLVSANCGWECTWDPSILERIEGRPLQNIELSANGCALAGELVVTRYGFEGTPLYTLGREIRKMDSPAIEIDFKPTFSVERLIAKMESARRNFYKEAKLRWKLSDVAIEILRQHYGEFESAEALARAAKCCRIALIQPRPIEEAISTAGGVGWSELDENLMLKKLPNVYCAGEMIDWEAPTGGYLLQGCFMTGTVTGKAASILVE